MAFGLLSASAQTKIGYINTDELMGVMPEAAKINEDLNAYQLALQQQGQTLQIEADKKRDQYFKDSVTLSASMKEIRRDELEAAQRARLTIGVGRAIHGQHRVAPGVVRAQRGEVGERH